MITRQAVVFCLFASAAGPMRCFYSFESFLDKPHSSESLPHERQLYMRTSQSPFFTS